MPAPRPLLPTYLEPLTRSLLLALGRVPHPSRVFGERVGISTSPALLLTSC